MIKKNKGLIYSFLILFSALYSINIYRLKLNSLEQRIKNIKDMIAYSKQQSSTFRGDKDFSVLVKPLALCGMVEGKRMVLELTDLEVLNVYNETEKMYFPAWYQKKYFIKNGQLLVIGENKEVSIFKHAYFFQDDQTIYLAGPDVLLTNVNCYRVP